MVVRYGQKGYVGLSMSENAKAAYEDGEMPYSKWTKARMITAIKDCCYDNDLKFDESIVRSMKKDDLFSRQWNIVLGTIRESSPNRRISTESTRTGCWRPSRPSKATNPTKTA